MFTDDSAWFSMDTDDLWIYDKLILSKKLGYKCGPVGVDVPEPGYYIVRPVMNFLGLGLGAEKVWINDSTDHLEPGHFWCEWFEGKHVSVDYNYGIQRLAVKGERGNDYNLMRWYGWHKIYELYTFPKVLEPLRNKVEWINCEFIGDKLIEVHFRKNPDFRWGNEKYIPVFGTETRYFEDETNWVWVDDPDMNGRTGAWVYCPTKETLN